MIVISLISFSFGFVLFYVSTRSITSVCVDVCMTLAHPPRRSRCPHDSSVHRTSTTVNLRPTRSDRRSLIIVKDWRFSNGSDDPRAMHTVLTTQRNATNSTALSPKISLVNPNSSTRIWPSRRTTRRRRRRRRSPMSTTARMPRLCRQRRRTLQSPATRPWYERHGTTVGDAHCRTSSVDGSHVGATVGSIIRCMPNVPLSS